MVKEQGQILMNILRYNKQNLCLQLIIQLFRVTRVKNNRDTHELNQKSYFYLFCEMMVYIISIFEGLATSLDTYNQITVFILMATHNLTKV